MSFVKQTVPPLPGEASAAATASYEGGYVTNLSDCFVYLQVSFLLITEKGNIWGSFVCFSR